jgi:biotin-dependent carboxylase-like uncharacterized protein
VPESGPADRLSHCLANRLVGNPPTAAALEVTLRGPEVRFHRAAYVAAVGGGVVLELDGWPVDAERVVAVAAGQRLRLVTTRSGARAYLAVAGSFRVAETMGSCATDTLSGIGPPPLRSGDQLGIGSGPVRLADHLVPERLGSVRRPLDGQPYTLRVLVGPDNGWFSSELGTQLGAARFTVDSSSNRVGIRLVSVGGNGGIERRGGELDSQGMVTGAVQVLPTGNPVVLLPDHATLGGYPVAAVVISADRHLLGQCRPGDEVRFEPVDTAQAVAAHRALRSVSTQAIVGRYPVLPS